MKKTKKVSGQKADVEEQKFSTKQDVVVNFHFPPMPDPEHYGKITEDSSYNSSCFKEAIEAWREVGVTLAESIGKFSITKIG